MTKLYFTCWRCKRGLPEAMFGQRAAYSGLGFFEDSIAALRSAADYLEMVK